MYLFYGDNISYFFVEEIPEDNLPNPTDDFSQLGNKSQKTYNPMDGGNSALNRSNLDNTSQKSRSRSILFKACEPTIFSEKAMQLKHLGMKIRQVIVVQAELGKVVDWRTEASVAEEKRPRLGPRESNTFTNVLLILEKCKGLARSKFTYCVLDKCN